MLRPPRFRSRKSYAERLSDAAFWRPYVEAACARHGLAHGDIRPGLPGTNAVFLVDRRYAVKIYTPLFDGAASYPAERDAYELLARAPEIPAPALVGYGALFPDDARWPWPYLITRALPGISCGEMHARIPHDDLGALAEALGPLLRRIHSIDLAGARRLRPAWDDFAAFLEEQRRACTANNRRWGAMPPRLLRQLGAYLPPVAALFDPATAPRLLHCDLNEDHVLVRAAGERWDLAGIIDFGDAKAGDPLYELATLHIGLFRCDKRLLRRFLESYGFDADLQRGFVQRAMSYALLHEFDVLGRVFLGSAQARAVAGLDDLAALLWDLERPGLAL